MAGFETVVRPVVFPVIRPTPKQSAAQKDDPNQGKAVITGSSGKVIDLPYSYSLNSTQSRQVEQQRRGNIARIYQKGDDGKVNKDNFIDAFVADKLWLREGRDDFKVRFYAPIEQYGEVGDGGENDNIEIRRRGVIKRNPNYKP